MPLTKEKRLVKGVKAILKDEGFPLIEEQTAWGYKLGYIVTPFGNMHFSIHSDGDSIFTMFDEPEKFPEELRKKMELNLNGKWNFHMSGVEANLSAFQRLFRMYITHESAWLGWFNGEIDSSKVKNLLFEKSCDKTWDVCTCFYDELFVVGTNERGRWEIANYFDITPGVSAAGLSSYISEVFDKGGVYNVPTDA